MNTILGVIIGALLVSLWRTAARGRRRYEAERRARIEAEKFARMAVMMEPPGHDGHTILGAALEGQGRYVAAAESFLRAAKLQPQADPEKIPDAG